MIDSQRPPARQAEAREILLDVAADVIRKDGNDVVASELEQLACNDLPASVVDLILAGSIYLVVAAQNAAGRWYLQVADATGQTIGHALAHDGQLKAVPS